MAYTYKITQDISDQFDDLVDNEIPNDTYYVTGLNERYKSSHITYLMKLILCANKFPDARSRILDLLNCDTIEFSINDKNSDGWTALHLAVINLTKPSDSDIIDKMINMGANPNNTTSIPAQHSVLHCALRSDCDASIITSLLNGNADPNSLETSSHIINNRVGAPLTPLMITLLNPSRSDYNKTLIADILINAGADINFNGTIDANCQWQLYSILHTLCRSHLNGDQSLETVIEYALRMGANVNSIDCNGCTPLHYICYDSHHTNKDLIPVIKLLISAGIDISLVNNYNSSALYYISSGNNHQKHEIAELLLENEAVVSLPEDLNGLFDVQQINFLQDQIRQMSLEILKQKHRAIKKSCT